MPRLARSSATHPARSGRRRRFRQSHSTHLGSCAGTADDTLLRSKMLEQAGLRRGTSHPLPTRFETRLTTALCCDHHELHKGPPGLAPVMLPLSDENFGESTRHFSLRRTLFPFAQRSFYCQPNATPPLLTTPNNTTPRHSQLIRGADHSCQAVFRDMGVDHRRGSMRQLCAGWRDGQERPVPRPRPFRTGGACRETRQSAKSHAQVLIRENAENRANQ